ncbi:lanC-like protein 2 isoform X5 [Osmerus mordax]|uniref:lanC-like protein 2 isoform X5 n=1 Tax=Osmerus mordax TaxID=8014 RepID=UPI003510C345
MGDNMSKRLKLVSATEAEMEERSFVNPYPDCDQGVLTSSNSSTDSDSNELFDANGKISEAFQKRVQNKIKDLLQQIEEGLKTADPHDFSTYTGWTGIALLYLQLHRVTCEASHLQRALDYVKRTLRNLNGRRVTFLCGDAGPLAVAAVVHHRLSNHTDSQDCIAKLLQLQRAVLSPDSEVPDELLYGRAGYLYALLYVNKEISPNTVDEGTITKPGSKVHQGMLSELVRPSIDYVRHKRFRSGNYPSSLSNETDRLVHWCHGAPGVVHMLIMAHKVFKEEKYLKEAQECGEVIWQRGLLRKGYGLCHGTAGNGYTFLSLYRLTQDRKHLYRACKFAEWCLDYGTHGCRIPDRPYSLFEGSNFISTFQPDNMNLFLAFSPQISLTVDTSTPLSLRMFWFQQRGFAHHGRLPPVTE